MAPAASERRMIMAEQLVLFDVPAVGKEATISTKKKRNWENGFQRWSNNQSNQSDGKSFGCCLLGAVFEIQALQR